MFQTTTYQQFFCLIFLLFILPCVQAQQVKKDQMDLKKPRLQLATKYHKSTAITDYWVSEKLDGVRGYWTGKQLLTRSGNLLSPPEWFIENWPKVAMGGELWSERGKFEQISACVRRKRSDGACWKNLKLMIFDLPQQTNSFTARIATMKQLIQDNHSPYLAMIQQQKVANNADLYAWLNRVVDNHGEGLMLHLASATYQRGRSKNLLKLKRHQDAEAVVIGHSAGKGKYQGLLGALLVKTPEGIIFKIGTGLSDHQRKLAPKVGSVITYKYIGKTQRGVPRFASFLRIKNVH
ncbi:DNA ligase [Cognaticolwellia beringensis]|uniref:DNA ligase n=1 Tax=Cognaticolwellia beringensis TaxID=1967665 RepID=A0A222G416_9GAMM|nr:DNA ligase [Cognaticolwellia beringensis]ASP46343.1 DNA ligase [Cognaticolwellia beringensis]